VGEDGQARTRRTLKLAQRADDLRALGRYIETFSMLVYWMRRIMVQRLSGQTTSQEMARLPFGEATADQITLVFFGMCRLQLKEDEIELDKEEAAIAARLETKVRNTSKKRNDIAHGDWFIGYGKPEDESVLAPMSVRTKPGRKDSPPSGSSEYSGDKALDALSDEMEELTSLVIEYGEVCIGSYRDLSLDGHLSPRLRVGDLLVIKRAKKGAPDRILREGPQASRINRA
jgi:hypothetical protein